MSLCLPKRHPLLPPSDAEETTFRRSTADRLFGQIYQWIFIAQLCALDLRKLVKELATGAMGQKIGLALLMIPSGPWGALGKEENQDQKCKKIKDKIQQLNLKISIESRCKTQEDVGRYIIFELMKSLVRSEGLTDPTSTGAVEKLRDDYLKSRKSDVIEDAMTNLLCILQFFDIHVCAATKQIATKDALVNSITGYSLPVAIDNCQKALKRNDKPTIVKNLEEISDFLLEMTTKLSEKAYDAQRLLVQAVQKETGREKKGGSHHDQPERLGGSGAAASGAGGSGGTGGGGRGWGRGHEDEEDEDSAEDESSDEVDSGRKRKKLRIALLNVRSVSKRSISQGRLIRSLILDNDLDFFLITETWLKPGPEGDDVLHSLLPPNHNFIHKPRGYGRGGGVAIVYSDQIRCESVALPYLKTFECVAGSVQHETWDRPILIITIYHPTATRYDDFFDFMTEFSLLLVDMSKVYSSIIVAGDFNIWIDDERTRTGREFNDLLRGFHLEQFVEGPTHQAGHTLDLVVGREINIANVYVKNDSISDHLTVYFETMPKKKDEDEEDSEDEL